MYINKTLMIMVLALSLYRTATAADHHIRPNVTVDAVYGCQYNGDGTTWACAAGAGQAGSLNTFPTTAAYTRGDTYFVSTGTHTSFPSTLTTAVSGTAVITIKKATSDTHGSATGWETSFGTGQAVINLLRTSINTSYWTIDGAVITDATSSAGYGFKFTPTSSQCTAKTAGPYIVGIPNTGYSTVTPNSVTITNSAIIGCGLGDGTYCTMPLVSTTHTGTITGMTISNNYFADGQNGLMIMANDGVVLDENYFANNFSSGTCHGEMINFKAVSNGVIKNNTIKNSAAYALGFHNYSGQSVTDTQVYNNIFEGQNGTITYVIGNADSGTANVIKRMQVHQNTFIDIAMGRLIDPVTVTLDSDKTIAYNNLIYNCSNPQIGSRVTHDYNAYYSVTGTKTTETNWIVASGDPFVNAAGGDYHLATSLTGTTLASPFDVDYDGVTRTVFSQGAYEFTGAYPIGGTVSGLGTGLTVTLQNNGVDTTPISANGTYSMLTSMATDSTYEITISSQPTGQTCIVSNPTGTVASAAITNIAVDCYWTVTASAGAGCNIAVEGETEVLGEDVARFAVFASSTYYVSSVSGTCGGYLLAGGYTTNSITADCTVIANCSLLTPTPYGATMTVGSGSAFTMGSGGTFVIQ